MSDINLVIKYDNGNIEAVSRETEKELGKAGKRGGENFSKGFSISLTSVAKNVAKVGAAIAAVGSVVIFKSVQAAQEQEDAVNRLNSALQITGKFSKETSDDLQAYASSLQEASKFGDEAILSAQGLIQSLGNLDKEGLKGATQATLDLAAALKIDLNSAATLVGKAATGEVSSFTRYGVAIKKGADNAETFSNALTALNTKFGGAAANEINTYSGAVTQASNSFGDFLEKIGDIIIKQPLFTKLLNKLSVLFQNLGARVVEFGKKFNIFDDLINPILAIGDAIIKYVATPLEFLLNIGTLVQTGLNGIFAKIIADVGKLGSGIAFVLDKLGIGEGLAEGLKTFSESSQEVADETERAFIGAQQGILDFPIADGLATKNENLRTFFQEQRAIIDEESAASAEVINTNVASVAETGVKAAEGLNLGFATLSAGFAKAATDVDKVNKQIASSVKSGVVNSISNGIQKSVAAIQNGENAFEAFGKAILSTFGDLAIQMGSFFIAQGIAIEAVQSVSGAGAVVAGVALIALGSLLKSFSGGGGGASAGGGGGGGSSAGFSSEPGTIDEGFSSTEAISQEPQTVVNVNVEGNSFGNEEFTRQIVESIGEEGGKQGLVFDNFQTA